MSLTGAQVLMLVALSMCVGRGLAQHDETVSPEARGAGVVEAVCSRIEASCVFSDDKLFTRRLAYVESLDGLHPDTFRDGYYGGIWQVDKVMFDATKQSAVLYQLRTTVQSIKTAFGIDWASVSWQDLTKPLHSAIGARLYLLYKAGTREIPRSIEDQANFWVSYYRPGSTASVFRTGAETTEKACSNTKGADIVFILDESGSVGATNFAKVKTFVKDVVKAFDIGMGSHQSRIAVTTYGSNVYNKFYLTTHKSQAAVLTAVDRIAYGGGNTATDKALNELINSFTAVRGARPKEEGHPRVGIVVTDGKSTQRALTLAAAKRVHEADITVFAVGVGSSLDMGELEAIASNPICLHLMLLTNFQEFDSLKYSIEKRTCDAPVIIGPGDPIDVTPGDGQNCKIKVPVGGITIQIEVRYGEITFFTSTATYPSRDYFEKKISARFGRLGVLFLTRPATNGTDGIIFCNIKGENGTEGGIGGLPGDHDKCKDKHCQNGGECVQNKAGHSWCECKPHYTGQHCESVINNCEPNPCEHGHCINSVGSYHCQCDRGYTGRHCDTVIDNCSSNPCHHGQCSNSVGSYHCTCNAGYTGQNCDSVIDNCSPNPCSHGQCSNSVGSYQCQCDTGYTGQNCDSIIDNCVSNNCDQGQCVNSVGSYHCECGTGYTGQLCDSVIDNCVSHSCDHGQCVNSVGSYHCECEAGYTGQLCDIEEEVPGDGYNCVTKDPCTQENINDGKFYFPHEDPTKFVQCSEWRQCFVKDCPAGTVWDQAVLTCNFQGGHGGQGGNGGSGSDGGYNCATNSPCTQENINAGRFYFPHTDPKKFVQCSQWGQCYEMNCGAGTVWDQAALTCNYPAEENPPSGGGGGTGGQGGYNCGANNPCTPENISTGKFYYPHTDPKKFVQCSQWGQCYEMNCGAGTVWDDATLTCNYPPSTISSTTPSTTTTSTTAIITTTFEI